MATPHVTGLVSILKMYDSSLTTQEAEILLKNYPKSVSSESSKPIANGVNFAAMMTAITTESHSE